MTQPIKPIVINSFRLIGVYDAMPPHLEEYEEMNLSFQFQ
jgi:hypothetical protein